MLRRHRMFVLALLLAALAGCKRDGGDKHAPSSPEDSTRMTTSSITEVLARHTAHLMSIPGIVGTAEGEQDGRPCIIIFVNRKTDALVDALPEELEGYPLRIDEVGEIKPLR
jgi:hypothetical protein